MFDRYSDGGLQKGKQWCLLHVTVRIVFSNRCSGA
jgi:hypothetical protein